MIILFEFQLLERIFCFPILKKKQQKRKSLCTLPQVNTLESFQTSWPWITTSGTTKCFLLPGVK